MEQKKNTTRPSAKIGLGGILLRAALILLCLVLLSVHLMGSLFAKYSSSADGSDSARVAKFDMKVVGGENVTVDCMTSHDGTYTFTVHNNSEVAVEYDVKVTYTQDVNYLTAYIDGIEQGWLNTSTAGFPNVGELAPGATSNSHELVFTVNWAEFTKLMTGDSVSEDVEFSVTVIVEQVD